MSLGANAYAFMCIFYAGGIKPVRNRAHAVR
jgi:hypothetical protein